METIWIESYARQINKVNRDLEEAAMMSSPVGNLDIKATAEMFRGAIAELKKMYEINKQLKDELDKLKSTVSGE